MKKNLDTKITTLKGEEVPVNGEPATVRGIVVDALLAQMPGENPDSKEKVDRYKLAVRLNDGGEQDLTPEEIVLIKKLVGKNYGPLVVGQVFALLDA